MIKATLIEKENRFVISTGVQLFAGRSGEISILAIRKPIHRRKAPVICANLPAEWDVYVLRYLPNGLIKGSAESAGGKSAGGPSQIDFQKYFHPH